MNNIPLTIIGTSAITEHHIKSAKKNGFKIIALSSTRKKSKYLKKISKKFKIKKIFNNYIESIKYTEQVKNAAYVVTCKTSDNYKVLKALRKSNRKILIEKPIFENFLQFKNIKLLRKNIFTGYNRMYYQNIIFLKKKISKKKNLLIRATAPENNINDINKNSCHIISILFSLFESIKINKIIKNKNHIICQLSCKQGKIVIFFNFRSSENTEIKINDEKKIYKLSPLEKLTIYNKMNIKNINGINRYQPNIYKIKISNLVLRINTKNLINL
jgi:NADPH:quinone reductase-like Zn-dependent oxidoreductase